MFGPERPEPSESPLSPQEFVDRAGLSTPQIERAAVNDGSSQGLKEPKPVSSINPAPETGYARGASYTDFLGNPETSHEELTGSIGNHGKAIVDVRQHYRSDYTLAS